jgi:hypothetical protein
MKKLIFAIITLLLSLFQFCVKRGSATIQGDVFEEGTNVPIPNAYVRMNKHSNIYSVDPITSATTDKNGHFKMRYFKGAIDYNYFLDVISGEHKSLFNKQIEDKVAHVTVILTPYAYIRFRVKNNLSYSVRVHADIIYDNRNSFDKYITGNSDITFTETFKAKMNGNTFINWYFNNSYNNTTYNTVYDSVMITNKFDTLTYLIELN